MRYSSPGNALGIVPLGGALVALLVTATLSAAVPLAQEWPLFHGDRRNSGYTDADAPFDSMLAWSYASTDSIVFSSPVTTLFGAIYVGNTDNELLALSFDGRERWRFDADGNFRHGTPAVGADGTVYIGDSNGILYAVHPTNTLRWTFAAGGAIKTSPTIGADGTIYFGCDDGHLYAVNPDSTLRWSYPAGDTIRSTPAIAPDGTILFGCLDSYLYALWPNGTLRWRAATGDQIKYSAPAVSEDNRVFFGSYDGFVYAVTTSQEFLWAYPTGNVVRTTPAIDPQGRVYIGSGDKLYCFNRDGDLEWDYSTNGTIYSSPVYFGDDLVICFGSDDGVFYCLHEDGSTDWTYTVNKPIRATPAPGIFGRIYVADVTGVIWSFGPSDVGVDEEAWTSRGVPVLVAPNPFCGATIFHALGPDGGQTGIEVFDALGRRVNLLQTDRHGRRIWNGRDAAGRALPTGSYFYRAGAGGPARRITLLR